MFGQWLRWINITLFSSLVVTMAACSAVGVQSATPRPSSAEPTTAPGAATPIVSHGGPVKDHVSFVDALRAKGLTVDVVDMIEQPFLRGNGTVLRLSGGHLKQPAELQSFNYDDTDLKTNGLKAAAEDAGQIEPNGNPRTARITWIAPPLFYHKERVIVIYLGSDPNVLALLTEQLGPQFAGK